MEPQRFDEASLEVVQQAIIRLWSQVLELDDINLEDNFFFLGGDSLKAVELMVVIAETFGIVLDPVEILERPTAEEFSTAIFNLLHTPASDVA